MPYKLEGKTVMVEKNGKWVKKGSGRNVATAKAYLRALYANMPKSEKGGK